MHVLGSQAQHSNTGDVVEEGVPVVVAVVENEVVDVGLAVLVIEVVVAEDVVVKGVHACDISTDMPENVTVT
jgi:hypothetical protein